MENKLSDWLNAQIRERGWSERELARRAKLSHSAINNALAGQYRTRLDTYKGIASAFGMDVDDVLRAAGELPPLPEPVAREQEVIRLFREIPDEYRDLILRVLAVAATQPASVDNATQSAPGDGILLHRWDDEHPLLKVLAELEDRTEDQVRDWLLDLIVEHGSQQLKRIQREGKPALEQML